MNRRFTVARGKAKGLRPLTLKPRKSPNDKISHDHRSFKTQACNFFSPYKILNSKDRKARKQNSVSLFPLH